MSVLNTLLINGTMALLSDSNGSNIGSYGRSGGVGSDLNNAVNNFNADQHPEGMDAFRQYFFRPYNVAGPRGDGGFSSIVKLLDDWIIVIFPIVFTFLFIFTFLNSPLKKRRGMGINAMATLVALFVLWTFMPMLASVVAGAGGSGASFPTDMLEIWKNIETLVPIAAAMATILGIGMALFSAPFQRTRGAGIGVVGFSILLWFVWLIAPQILASLTGAS